MDRLSVFVRSATFRRSLIAAFVFSSILLGLTLREIIPQYDVDHLHRRGGAWQDHPSFLVGDCPWYRATLLSLIHDRDLDIGNNVERRQYPPSENIAQGQRGEWYPKHPVLMPIAAIPFYLIARDRGLVAFNVVQLSLLLTLMWYGASRYTSMAIATGIAFWFAFGTMMHAAAYNFAPDVFSSLLVVAGFVAVLNQRVYWAGALLGFAAWAKWTNVIFLPLPVLYLLLQRDLRAAVRFVCAGAVPILGLLAMNQHMFGSPFLTPYDRVLVLVHRHYVLEPSHRSFFNVPFWTGLWQQLTDRDLGLLMACPPIVFAPYGAYLMSRRSVPDMLLIVGACVAQLAMFAKYEQWYTSTYGPRFLMTVVALSALLVAPVVDRLFAPWRAANS